MLLAIDLIFITAVKSFAVQSHKVMHSLLSFSGLLDNVEMSSTVFALSYICFEENWAAAEGTAKSLGGIGRQEFRGRGQ